MHHGSETRPYRSPSVLNRVGVVTDTRPLDARRLRPLSPAAVIRLTAPGWARRLRVLAFPVASLHLRYALRTRIWLIPLLMLVTFVGAAVLTLAIDRSGNYGLVSQSVTGS